MSEIVPLFGRRTGRSAPPEALEQRDETIATLRRRLEDVQTALEASARERDDLQEVVRELTAEREEIESLTLLLAEALRAHRAALGALEQALG